MYLRFVVRIFYSNRTFALLFIPILVGGFVALNQFFPYHKPEELAHFGMWGQLLPQSHWLSWTLAPTLIVTNAIMLNWIFNRNEFLERNNYLVALLYITLLSYFHSFYFLDGFSIAQFIVTFGVYYLFQLNQNDDARKVVFNTAFLFGIAATFYPLFLISIPLLFFMIWITRPFIMRESVLTVVGFVLPLVYAGVYAMVYEFKMEGQDFSSSSSEIFVLDLLIIGSSIVWFMLFSLKTLFRKMQQGSIRIRKHYNVLILLGLLATLLTFMEYFVFKKAETLSLVLIPLMFVLPYGFGYKKQRQAPTVFYYLIFLFSVGKFFNFITI